MQSAPKPDPSLAVERERTQNEKRDAIQERLAATTALFMRQFGARRALNGGSARPAIMAGL
jgi:hypothetical protein